MNPAVSEYIQLIPEKGVEIVILTAVKNLRIIFSRILKTIHIQVDPCNSNPYCSRLHCSLKVQMPRLHCSLKVQTPTYVGSSVNMCEAVVNIS